MAIADKQSKQLRRLTKKEIAEHLKSKTQHTKTIANLRQKILKFQRTTTPIELPNHQLVHIPWIPNQNVPLREDQYQEYVDGLAKAEAVDQYIGSIFQINHRLYEVLYIYYDMDKKALAAYRRPIDGLPANTEDGLPALFEGKNNIKERILDYEDCADFTKDSLRWPENETDMRNAQMTDPELATIIRALESNTALPQHLESNIIEYTIQDDEQNTSHILRGIYKHRQQTSSLDSDTQNTVTIIPQNLKAFVLKYYHNDLGHPGIERLRMSISLKYYWEDLQQDTRDYVRNCRFCAARKADNTKGKIPRFRFPNTRIPFQRTNIDIIGPLPITDEHEYRYILVIKEPITQWIEAVPLPDKTAETVTHAIINNLYNVHGIPNVIITDNGTEFVNNTAALVHELLQTTHHTTVPYHPEANGLVENQNRTIKDMLSSFIDANQLDWPKWLPIMVHAYRTTVSPITGFSPFRLLYGREARQPSDSWITKFALKQNFDINKYVARLTEIMISTWDKSSTRIDHIHTQRDKTHNNPTLRSTPAKEKYFIPYETDDLFMLESIPKRYILETTPTEKLRLKINAKLQMRYIGPYTVTKVINPTTYLARIDNKEIRVHASRMKRVHPSRKDYLPIFSQFFDDDISDDSTTTSKHSNDSNNTSDNDHSNELYELLSEEEDIQTLTYTNNNYQQLNDDD